MMVTFFLYFGFLTISESRQVAVNSIFFSTSTTCFGFPRQSYTSSSSAGLVLTLWLLSDKLKSLISRTEPSFSWPVSWSYFYFLSFFLSSLIFSELESLLASLFKTWALLGSFKLARLPVVALEIKLTFFVAGLIGLDRIGFVSFYFKVLGFYCSNNLSFS